MQEEFIHSILLISEKVDFGVLFLEYSSNKKDWKITTINKPFFNHFQHPYSNIKGQFFSDSWVSSITEIASSVDNSYLESKETFTKTISLPSVRNSLQICYNKNTILFLSRTNEKKEEVKKENIDNELFKTLLNHSPDLIYFKDKDARFIKNSKSHCDFLGIKQEDLIGKTDLDVFNESVAEEKYHDDLNVINTGVPIINKEEADITTAKTRWVTSTKLPIKNENDNIIGLFGISRDISEKRKAEQKIKRLNDNFQLLITTSLGFQQTAKIDNLFRVASNLILEKFEDIQLVFLYKNPSKNKFDISFFPNIKTNKSSPYRNVIDYVLSHSMFNEQIFENERITINISEFFQKYAIKGFNEIKFKYASVYQLKQKVESLGYALIFRNIDFEEHDILFLKVLINQLTLTIARINLIEELKDSIQKAKESDKLKTAFLNNISHEVRTPLNSVIGYSQILSGRIGNNETQLKTYAINVINNAKILLELIEDIIEISKIESGQVSIIQNETNINELVDSLYLHLNEQLKRYNKEHILTENVKSEITDNPLYNIDSIRIFQLLKALINNAVKFTEEGKIRIGYLTGAPQEITFFVEDSGIGIPDEASDVIFNLFRQGDESATRKYGGTGIGLSIAKSLAEKLGGKITFKSAPKKGSTFYFILPLE